MPQTSTNRLAAVAAIAGAILLVVGTALHPMDADPNDPLAAFTEYATDTHWVASHLTQLAGVASLVAALVLLADMLASTPARRWALLGASSAVASVAAAAALQAVDGVALRAMVGRWAAGAEPDKAILFQATVAVRQIEIGLASVVSLLFGVTAVLYGIALRAHPAFHDWLAWFGILSGIALAVSGVATAYTGFSVLAMNISMPASTLLLAWVGGLAIRLWRLPTGGRS